MFNHIERAFTKTLRAIGVRKLDTIKLPSSASRVVHLTFQTHRGSCEHYFHFLLGYLLPLGAYLGQRGKGDDCVIVARSCGLLDRILHELMLPNLLLCERLTHASIKDVLKRAQWGEVTEISGFDGPPWYDAREIESGVDFVRRRLASAVEAVARDLEGSWPERPRILMIERGEADPFYQSSVAEVKTAASQRRSIANHDELSESLAAAYPGFRSLKLEALPLAAQLAYFRLADIVAAQHGAALSNVVWMRPGTQVIEIDPTTDEFPRFFEELAKVRGLKYLRLRQETGPFGAIAAQELTEAISRMVGLGKN